MPGLQAQICLASFAHGALRQDHSCQNMVNIVKYKYINKPKFSASHPSACICDTGQHCPTEPLEGVLLTYTGVQLPRKTAVSQGKWKPGSNMRKHFLIKDDVRLLIWRLSDLSLTGKPKQQTRKKNPGKELRSSRSNFLCSDH